MKKILAILFISAIGLGFVSLSEVLKDNHERIGERVEQVAEDCVDIIRCALFGPALRDIHNSTEALRRQAISKDDLPIVRISMSDGAIERLAVKRNSVLAKARPIHLAESKDWVSASVFVEYAGGVERSDVSLRLKGDWGDHLTDPKKWSLRMKTRAGGYLFGMRSLSIQHPKTRNFGLEPAALMQMRENDVIAPRYSFVDVIINDFPIGVMALEEHFGKELLEAQDRRDGPILALDEDALWVQRDINYNSPSSKTTTTAERVELNFSPLRDSLIKDFNDAPFERGTIATNNSIRGQALLRDFLDGKVSSRETFDYEKLSRYWVLINIWRGCHGSAWHNRRFYFNPISGLLEPIGFDMLPKPEAPEPFQLCSGIDSRASLQDPQFLEHVEGAASEILDQLESAAFSDKLSRLQNEHGAIFRYEGFSGVQSPVETATLIANMRTFLAVLLREHKTYGKIDKTFVRSPKGHVGARLLAKQAELGTHLTSYYYPSASGDSIAFRNLTLDDIEILRIYGDGKRGRVDVLDVPSFILGKGDQAPFLTSVPVTVSDALLREHSKFVVDYVYKDEAYSRSVDIQHKNYSTGFAQNPFATLQRTGADVRIGRKRQQIILSGDYTFTQSIALPKDWRVNIKAGARLNFQDGALLKLQGPLIIEGTSDAPVLINVESNTEFRDMGAWGGIFVSKSRARSRVNFLELRGTGTQNLANRQGYYGMTGCMSFYESDVDVSNSRFVDAQCEDALNIVKADFVLDNTEISGARADAFDSDFSIGLIKDSVFINSGNDGVDISGTSLKLENITMTNIGDKAISVGEKSTLDAQTIQIDGANLGLVSKDLSIAAARDVVFSNVQGTALMTYIKKQEYGPSSIECSECTFLTEMTKTGAQEGTRIVLNGISGRRGSLTLSQMLAAGLIEDASDDGT